MYVLQRPAAIRAAPGLDQLDRLSRAFVRRDAGAAQVLEPAQNIVMIAGWERELSPGRVDHLTCGEAMKHATREDVFLSPLTRRCHCWRAARGSLVFQESLE